MTETPRARDATGATPALSPKEIRALRARAHGLKPVVWIAASGPTEGVLRELDRALAAHELVKIHAASDDRDERARLLAELCEKVGAHPVQIIGKMLVAYRPRPPEDRKPRPARAGKPAAARGKRAAGAPRGKSKAKGTGRRGPQGKGSERSRAVARARRRATRSR